MALSARRGATSRCPATATRPHLLLDRAPAHRPALAQAPADRPRRAGSRSGTMSRPVGRRSLVELDLPVPAREGDAVVEVADVRLDRLAARPCGRSARGRCGPAGRRTSAPANAPPKRVLTSVMPRPISGSRNACTVHGPRTPSASPTARPSSISSGSAMTVPLIDSPPRDSIIVRGIAFRQRPSRSHEQVDRELRAAHQPLDHHRLLDVADEEVLLLAVGGRVDRARARALARLDHHRVGSRAPPRAGTSAGSAARGRAAARASRTCRTSPARPRRSGRTPAGRRAARTSRSRSVSGTTAPRVVARDELLQERHVAGVVDPRRDDARRRPRSAPARAGSGRPRS